MVRSSAGKVNGDGFIHISIHAGGVYGIALDANVIIGAYIE